MVAPWSFKLSESGSVIGRGGECIFQMHCEPAYLSGVSNVFLYSKSLAKLFDRVRAVDQKPNQNAFDLAKEISKASCQSYSQELDLRQSIWELLNHHFSSESVTISQEKPVACKSSESSKNSDVKVDILFEWKSNSGLMVPFFLFEAKNELGPGQDPISELIAYTMKYTANQSCLASTSCPMLLLSLSGAQVILFGSVFVGKYYLFDHITSISLWYSPHSPYLMTEQAHFWASLFTAVEDLKEEYASMLEQSPPAFSPWKPYLSKFTFEGKEYTLKYQETFEDQDYLFKAKAKSHDGERWVVVKFSHTYCKELHELLATNGLAPSLLHFDSLPAGWKVAVMNYVEDARFWNIGKEDEHLTGKLDTVLSLMNDQNLVHGDLRDRNILVHNNEVFIIDFEFGGTEGNARYPYNLSTLLEVQNAGAKKSGVITKEHDQ